MIALLIVCVVCIILTLLNLGILLAVFRRLREQTDLLNRINPDGSPMLEPGAAVPAFAAEGIDGEPISSDFERRTLFGAFSTDCDACIERVPEFVEVAANFPGGRSAVLALITGPRQEALRHSEALAPVSKVIVERIGGPVADSFAIRGYPCVATIGADGRILASGTTMDAVAAPVEA